MTDLCKAMNNFGKGIGSTSRYRIVEALFSGPKTVGELVEKTNQSQPLVSQHLRVLKEVGLVQDERRGQEVFYTLNAEHMINLLKKLSEELRPKNKK
jgi:DNA-binding transcriptional ArsR family regulator